MIPATVNWQELSEAQQNQMLRRPALAGDTEIKRRVAEIVAAVRAGGDATLLDLTEKFDRVRLTSLRVGQDEIQQAQAQLSAAELSAIDTAIENVRRFHEAQSPAPVSVETVPGVRCDRICQALDSVGLYVPAGSAPLPSTAIMLCVPARLAGCPDIALCTPPRPDGTGRSCGPGRRRALRRT